MTNPIPLATAFLAISAISTLAASGDLDTTFGGGDGFALNAIGGGQMLSGGITLQPDGKILAVGSAGMPVSGFLAIRYQTDGSLDPTFGGGAGFVQTSFGVNYQDNGQAVALQTDGKIVVVGQSASPFSPGPRLQDLAVARYLANGTLDAAFGVGGKVTTDASVSYDDYGTDVAIQTDQKIVVAGTSYLDESNNQNFTLVRYLTDGTLDTTFGGTGKVLTDFGGFDSCAAVAIQPDGRIVQIGDTSNADRRFALVRYNTDGTLDTTFGEAGKVITDVLDGQDDYCQAVTILSNGRILVAGSAYNSPNASFELVRYNADGSLDTTFGTGGIVITDSGAPDDCGVNGVMVDSAGRIVVTGYVRTGFAVKFAMLRYTAGGVLDTSFGGSGIVTSDPTNGGAYISGTALDRSGRIVAFGTMTDNSNPVSPSTPFAVARYLTASLTANAAPVVRLQGSKKIKTKAASVKLKGTASDDSSVAKVLVSGRTARGTTNWSYNAKLKNGKNKLTITAVDGSGLTSAPVTVTITRRK